MPYPDQAILRARLCAIAAEMGGRALPPSMQSTQTWNQPHTLSSSTMTGQKDRLCVSGSQSQRSFQTAKWRLHSYRQMQALRRLISSTSSYAWWWSLLMWEITMTAGTLLSSLQLHICPPMSDRSPHSSQLHTSTVQEGDHRPCTQPTTQSPRPREACERPGRNQSQRACATNAPTD